MLLSSSSAGEEGLEVFLRPAEGSGALPAEGKRYFPAAPLSHASQADHVTSAFWVLCIAALWLDARMSTVQSVSWLRRTWRTPFLSITHWPWELPTTARGPTSSTWGRRTGGCSSSRHRKPSFTSWPIPSTAPGSTSWLNQNFLAGTQKRCSRGSHASIWWRPCFLLLPFQRRSALRRDSVAPCCRVPTPS